MDKAQIAEALHELAVLMELTGANPFKVRAYENAARIVDGVAEDIGPLIEKDALVEIKGIGRNLADHIAELYGSGEIAEYADLKKSVPEGVIEMLSIPGLGPKKVAYLWREMGIKSAGELEFLCKRHIIAGAPGFGAKTEEKIIAGIAMLRRFAGKRLFSEAAAQAKAVHRMVGSWPEVDRSEVAGSVRRCREVVGDVDMIAASTDPAKVMDRFVSMPIVERVLQHGEKKSEVILESGMQCDLRVVTEEQFPFALHYFTGSKEHNVRMRTRAKSMGLKLNEYGLFKAGSEKSMRCADEAALFAALGMDYVEPELREDMGELEAATDKRLPKLVEDGDLKGVLHVHSNYSDGEASIEKMAEAARGMGFEYLAICDHSRVLTVARGMKPADVKRQHREIDALNKKFKNFLVLKGIEVDVLADGSLDFEDDLLAAFDIVIASVHTRFNMPEEEMTRRIIKGISNPFVHALAHPTGRLLLARDPYAVDMNRVLDAAAELGVAMEINAHPQRLDLDWRWCKRARDKGVKFIICPDAHSPDDMGLIGYGVNVARKGWLAKGDILNCFDAHKLLEYLRRKRSEEGRVK